MRGQMHMSCIKRVTVVTETFYPEVNGVANTLYFLVKGLKQQNIDVQVIRPKQSHDSASHTHSSYHTTLVPGLPIPGYKQLKFGLPFVRRIRKAIVSFNPDAVYIATEGPLGLSALRIAKKCKLPVLSGFHTNFHQYFEHYHLAFLKAWVFKYLRAFHNATERTLVPTKLLQLQLAKQGFKRVHVMARGVDDVLFSPSRHSEALRQTWGVKPNEPVLLYVGRIAGEKNITLALQSFDAFHAIQPSAKMVLVGDGPLSAALAKEYPDAIFVGVKRGESLAEYYASADIFLFPSVTDTFGNVVLEAMASGLHVLAFDYAAAATLIQHGVNGSVAEHQNSQDFLNKIKQMALMWPENPQTRQQARITSEQTSWQLISEEFAEQLKMIKEEKSDGSHQESMFIPKV